MRLTIVVRAAPVGPQASYSALLFARAALGAGHQVERVFFHGDGVYNGAATSVPPQGEADLCADWAELGRNHGLDLVVCVNSALKRGLLDPGEAERYERDAITLRPEFAITGLGQLIDAAVHSDRLITFGA